MQLDAEPPVFIEPRSESQLRQPPRAFRQGAHAPFGIRWYGITSLFGHLRNFVARAIATESVDSRDWMRPNAPEALLRLASDVLARTERGKPSPEPDKNLANATTSSNGSFTATAATLTGALGRAVWIDFVADTGDDRDVSAAVGQMVAAAYETRDEHGTSRILPRGDLLIFGGDIAYPVATADEIEKRLILPWNETLRRHSPRASANANVGVRKRVVLGVPGNHDWYDGLDGFGRLFRRSPPEEPFVDETKSRVRTRRGRKAGLVARQLHFDEVGSAFRLLVGFFTSLRAFLSGTVIKRRRRLVLRGYVPVQEASYFAMPLATGLDLFGADRQLGRVDFRQRSYFSRWRKAHSDRAVLFVAGDPVSAYGMRNEPGFRMLEACGLSLERDRVFFMAGDFHHYERRRVNGSMHVIAGGGGAFLHGTRISPYPAKTGEPDAVYPSGAASRKLVAQVPLKLAFGRAGWLVHVAFAGLALLEIRASDQGPQAFFVGALAAACGMPLALYFIAHQGHGKRQIAQLASFFGVALGLLPGALRLGARHFHAPALASDTAVVLASAFAGAFLFGVYLAILATLGFEHQQAFTVLGHPGYKHFVRLCVHPDGRIEAWTVGKDDMLVPGAPALIDAFTWG